jgi:hypothetical protein
MDSLIPSALLLRLKDSFYRTSRTQLLHCGCRFAESNGLALALGIAPSGENRGFLMMEPSQARKAPLTQCYDRDEVLYSLGKPQEWDLAVLPSLVV